MAKIIHRKSICTGCGLCSVLCPSFFEMKGPKAHLKNASEKKGEVFELKVEKIEACVYEAEKNCPVQCIETNK